MEHYSIVFNSIVLIFYLLQFSNVRKCHKAEQLNGVRGQVPHLPTQLKWGSGTGGLKKAPYVVVHHAEVSLTLWLSHQTELSELCDSSEQSGRVTEFRKEHQLKAVHVVIWVCSVHTPWFTESSLPPCTQKGSKAFFNVSAADNPSGRELQINSAIKLIWFVLKCWKIFGARQFLLLYVQLLVRTK